MRLPIRARLTLVAAALLALVVAAMGAFLYLQLRSDLHTTVDTGLRSHAESLRGDPGRTAPTGRRIAESEESFSQLLTAQGAVARGTPAVAERPLLTAGEVAAVDGVRFFDASIRADGETVPVRLLATPLDDGRVLVVGAAVEDQQEALARLLVLLIVGGPIAVLLASLVCWQVSGAALRPVGRLRREAEAISASEPGRRLAVPPTRDELTELAASLNRMLGRLEEAVRRERRFVDDASHELRTPLANLKAELELATRRARTPEELTAAIRSATEETDRLIALAEDLLVLARANGGELPLRREETDVGALVDEVVRAFGPRAAEAQVSLRTSNGVGTTSVDVNRIRQAVGNLVDNAIRHTAAGGRVEVSLREADGVVVLEVVDTGPGFPEEFLPSAFEAFTRADDARTRGDGGAGLGLAIVAAVAKAHGGTATADNGAEGGAVVRITIPRD
ncbi:ATP-binding protein [Nocardioides speluncae]|uniref:ATP-binding protein n=1 Tax=Nocardioides speluncae TaxID=2670337 RepID=UPI000D694466|nr:ATP-binding protein [Nocardioides speluncae]